MPRVMDYSKKKLNSAELIKDCSKTKQKPISKIKIKIDVRKEMPWTMQNI